MRTPKNTKPKTSRSAARTKPEAVAAISALGERVRCLRKELELSQAELAEQAELDDKHIQDIEGGRTNPTLATLVMLSKALKKTISELLFGV